MGKFCSSAKASQTDNSDEITINEVLSSPPPPPPLPLPSTPSAPSVPVDDPASNENEAGSSGSTNASKTYATPAQVKLQATIDSEAATLVKLTEIKDAGLANEKFCRR